MPEKAFVSPADPDAWRTVPTLAFLVSHPSARLCPPFDQAEFKSPFRMLFDLGLRSSQGSYIPEIKTHLDSRQPSQHRPSARETLESGGIESGDIDAIVISHVHWDHHGDPEHFSEAQFIVGPGATEVLEKGMPGRGTHSHFDAELFGECKRLKELPEFSTSNTDWQPLGPFPATLDIFGDKSAYIVHTPGHLPGHLNMLCRTAPKKWIYLGADVYHDNRLLTGEKQIATWSDPAGTGQTFCVHVDREMAQKSIQRVRDLIKTSEESDQEVEVIIAHDAKWLEANQSRLFPKVL